MLLVSKLGYTFPLQVEICAILEAGEFVFTTNLLALIVFFETTSSSDTISVRIHFHGIVNDGYSE